MPADLPAAEPAVTTPPELQALLRELEALEPLYHAAAPAASVAHFDALVPDEFWEIGASGRPYSRAYARAVLASRSAVPPDSQWQTRNFQVRALADDTYLLTYTLDQIGRSTLRSTVWKRVGGRWQVLFHQGTIVQA